MADTPQFAIIGKGALGLLYASVIQDNLGSESVFFVMDDERLARHAEDRYTVNDVAYDFRDVRTADAPKADMVIVAVKSTGLDAAMDLINPLLKNDTLIVPLLNGITSERRIAARFGWEHVLTCIAAKMDAERYGTQLKYTKAGELQIGAANGTPPSALERASELLRQAGVNFALPEDIVHAQWAKFMCNTGVNQCCAAFGLSYGELFADQTSVAYRTFIGAMREVMAAGKAEGVALEEADMNGYIEVLLSLDPNSTPSMGQDRINRNPSEVDEFSGEVLRLADKHGIQAPCNRYLYNAIRAYEALC